jgi:uncharacterized membrane protein HdeD (DUF308 family)
VGSSRRLLLAAGCAVALAGACVLFVFDPTVAPFYPRCLFHSLTGLQCPGCGTTRALHHLLHGRVREAFQLNAMLFVLGPFLMIGGAAELRSAIHHAPRPGWLLHPWVGWAAASLVIGWWIVRNLV